MICDSVREMKSATALCLSLLFGVGCAPSRADVPPGPVDPTPRAPKERRSASPESRPVERRRPARRASERRRAVTPRRRARPSAKLLAWRHPQALGRLCDPRAIGLSGKGPAGVPTRIAIALGTQLTLQRRVKTPSGHLLRYRAGKLPPGAKLDPKRGIVRFAGGLPPGRQQVSPDLPVVIHAQRGGRTVATYSLHLRTYLVNKGRAPRRGLAGFCVVSPSVRHALVLDNGVAPAAVLFAVQNSDGSPSLFAWQHTGAGWRRQLRRTLAGSISLLQTIDARPLIVVNHPRSVGTLSLYRLERNALLGGIIDVGRISGKSVGDRLCLLEGPGGRIAGAYQFTPSRRRGTLFRYVLNKRRFVRWIRESNRQGRCSYPGTSGDDKAPKRWPRRSY